MQITLSNRQKNSHTNKGGVYMATSSITKNFVISGQKQVEMFVDAIESSANNRPVRVPVAARELTFVSISKVMIRGLGRPQRAFRKILKGDSETLLAYGIPNPGSPHPPGKVHPSGLACVI